MELNKIYDGMPQAGSAIGENFEKIVKILYPVGAIYFSMNNTDPAKLMGGRWEQIKGKVLVGVDDTDSDFRTAGNNGGEKTHLLTERESGVASTKDEAEDGLGLSIAAAFENRVAIFRDNTTPHNNMPPYEVVYIWKRIG